MAGAPSVNLRAVLTKSEILGHLSAEQIEFLSARCTVRRCAMGETVFERGTPGTSLLGVISGPVKVSVLSADGRELILNIIKPGEVFGEIGLRLIELLCRRLRTTSQQVEEMQFLELPVRLARALLHLAETDGANVTRGRRLNMRLSQSDLGMLIGASRERISLHGSATGCSATKAGM